MRTTIVQTSTLREPIGKKRISLEMNSSSQKPWPPDFSRQPLAQPLYEKLRDVLVQRIVAGDWKPGTSLPNEITLAQEFGVSIGTVRKALDTMEKEHIIVRRQGRGTFVSDHTSEASTSIFSAFYDLEGRPVTDQKQGKSVLRRPALSHEAEILGVETGDEIVQIERTRSHHGQTFLTEVCLLPAKICENIQEDVATYRVSALAQMNAIILRNADESLSVTTATEGIAKDLGIPEKSAVLRLERRIFTDTGRVFEWRIAHCCLRHERYQVRFT